jgi:hypothetical protein
VAYNVEDCRTERAAYTLLSPSELAGTLTIAAIASRRFAGARLRQAFRPHAGWRDGQMHAGQSQIDYRLMGLELEAMGLANAGADETCKARESPGENSDDGFGAFVDLRRHRAESSSMRFAS